MFDLKPITKSGIPKAIEKAQHYRLLNEPRQAESICRDVLHLDKENEKALVMLVLALTDQFGKGLHVSIEHAQEVLPRLRDEYDRTYYAGIIFERWAKAQLAQDAPGYVAYDWLQKAMNCYEQAQTKSPTDNDDAILRWNTCVRILKRNEHIRPRLEEHTVEADFSDDMPVS